jgi:hypothetical protein
MSPRHIRVPVAVHLGVQKMFVVVPPVERSDDGYRVTARIRAKRGNKPYLAAIAVLYHDLSAQA